MRTSFICSLLPYPQILSPLSADKQAAIVSSPTPANCLATRLAGPKNCALWCESTMGLFRTCDVLGGQWRLCYQQADTLQLAWREIGQPENGTAREREVNRVSLSAPSWELISHNLMLSETECVEPWGGDETASHTGTGCFGRGGGGIEQECSKGRLWDTNMSQRDSDYHSYYKTLIVIALNSTIS